MQAATPRLRLQDAIFVAGVTLRLAMSNIFLNSFVGYTATEGSVVFKFHPGTYLIFLAVLLGLRLRPAPPDFRKFQRAAAALLIILGYATFANVLKFGTSSVAFVVETYVSAILVGLYLVQAPPHVSKVLLRILFWLVGINAAMAVVEVAIGQHLLPNDGLTFTFFRAYAIFGHPLANALLTSIVILSCLINRPLGRWSFAYFALGGVAILAFGARAATMQMTLITVATLLWIQAHKLLNGRARVVEWLSLMLGMGVSLAVGMFLVLQTSIGDRFREMSSFDDSSTGARLNILSIYDSLSVSDMIWGISPATKAMLIEQSAYFNTLENFWVDMSLSYGLLVFPVIALALVVFLWRAARDMRLKWFAIFVLFLTLASTNNSLSVKSPLLIGFVLLTIASRRVATAPDEPAPAPQGRFAPRVSAAGFRKARSTFRGSW